MRIPIALLGLLLSAPAVVRADKPTAEIQTTEHTAEIIAIDRASRAVTLMDKEGVMQTILASPEVRRFDELKVGQNVTFRHSLSVAYQIRKPGEATAEAGLTAPEVERRLGPKP